MKKITSKRLLQYSALTAAIAGVSDASGQLVYTDIEPDFVGTAYDLDINNDGTVDASIAVGGTSITPVAGNAYVGFAASSYFYPSNLGADVTIDVSSPTEEGRGDMWFGPCYPNSQWCDGPQERFIGFNLDVGGETFFGWLRMSINADNTEITVLDYAHNGPGEASVTGETLLAVADNVIEGFTSFVDSNNFLNLTANSSLENVVLNNIAGQQVISQKLANTTESIDLNTLSTGVYIATVTTEGQKTAFKVVKK